MGGLYNPPQKHLRRRLMKKLNFTENGNFTMVPNGILRSGKLSAKALGVYFLIVSLPDNRNFSVKGLCTLCSDGKTSIASAVAELEKAGFIKRQGLINRNGKLAAGDWTVCSDVKAENSEAEKQMSENLMSENLMSENLMSENQPQLNTKQQKTKQTNTKQVKDSSYELYVARENAQPVIQRNAYMRSLRRFSQSHLQFQKLSVFYKSHGDFVRFFPTPTF